MHKNLLKVTLIVMSPMTLHSEASFSQILVNDDACGAIELTPNADGLSCPPEGNDYTTEGATNSTMAGPCGYTPSGDVWFRFTATADSHRINLSKIRSLDGGYINPGLAVYQSFNCSSLGVALECKTSGAKVITLATLPGQSYFVRVWTSGGSSGFESRRFSFKLCLGAPTSAPSNDECVGAIELNGGTVYEVYTHNATGDASTGQDCWGYAAGPSEQYVRDVWYKVTANTSGPFTVWLENYSYYAVADYSQPNGGWNASLEYRTSCASSFVPEEGVNCKDATFDFWTMDSTGRFLTLNAVEDQVYYFRVWQHNQIAIGEDGGAYMRIWAEEPVGGDVLPVEFGKLTAYLNAERSVTLSWDYYVIDSDNGVVGFEVEHSTNGLHFIPISKIPSLNDKTTHQFIHTQLTAGSNFYRIAVKGKDGQYKYSNTTMVEWNVATGFQAMRISPNPINTGSHIELYFVGSPGVLTIVDVTGKKVGEWVINEDIKRINPRQYNMNPGIYMVNYQSSEATEVHRLIIQ